MNNKDEILRQFERILSWQEEALSTLYRNTVQSTEAASFAQEMANGVDPMSDPYPGPPLWDTDWDDLKIMAHWVQRTDIATVKTYSRGIYAGGLFLVLNNWIQSLGVQLGLEKQEDRLSVGEQIGKTQLSRLIWAAANNFRHYAEWASPDDTKAQRSISVLQAAGVTGLMSENRASDVLNVIGAKDYKNLEAKIYAIGQELKKKAS